MALNTEHFISEAKTHCLTFRFICYRTVSLTVSGIFFIQLRAIGKDVMFCIYSLSAPCFGGSLLGAVAILIL